MADYEITAVFTRDDFILDSVPAPSGDCFFDQAMLDDFANDKWKSLFDLGFGAKNETFTAPLA
jgi:hypothetical protein